MEDTASKRKKEATVVGAATSPELVKRLNRLGVVVNKAGIPVVGVSGLMLGLAQPRELPALCLLGETIGYVPDPRAAKSVLKVLVRLLDIDLDFAGIEDDITKMAKIESKIREVEEDMDLALKGKVSEKTVGISPKPTLLSNAHYFSHLTVTSNTSLVIAWYSAVPVHEALT